jgi:nitrogen regulatory protein P-II 1
MKLISAIIEQVTVEGLAAALPTTGVESLTISEVRQYQGGPVTVEVYRGVELPKYFSRLFRVEFLVDDDAVDRVLDSLSFAAGTGLLGDTKTWVIDTGQVTAVRQRPVSV